MTIYTDPDSQTTTISDVHSGSVTFETGWSFGWSEDWPTPQVGDDVTIVHSGSFVRGLALGDQVLFYRTAEEDRQHHETKAKAKNRAERIEFYLEADTGHMAPFLSSYATLPWPFQRRIQKFVGERDDWIRRFGNYEMSACLDAVKVGDWLLANGATEDNLKRFQETPPPIKLWDGHSGNSYDFSCRLGWWYATDSNMVVLEHGALTPLVGCDEYGCPHPFPHEEPDATP